MVTKQIKKRAKERSKKYGLTLILIFIQSLVLIFIILFTKPSSFAAIPLFLFILYSNLIFISSIIFANTKRGFTFSTAILLFLLLRIFQIGNLLNLILIIGILITYEIYTSNNH